MHSIVVTGVSSGIGEAILKLAAAKQFHVFGSVRKEADARALQAAYGDRFTPLIFDVRDEAAIAAQAAVVRDALKGQTLKGLVNNAGMGLAGPILHQPVQEIRDVLDTNLLGPILVTRAMAPLLGADPSMQGPKGRIVNISSIAGKIAQPFAGAYVSSKHGLEGLSDVLRRELNLYGIFVSIVAPAAVKTPIWKFPEAAIGRYANTPFGPAFDKGVRAIVDESRKHGLNAESVARTVWLALTARSPRLRYAPAQHMFFEQILPRLAPDRAIDFVVRQSLGLKPGGKASRQAD